MLHFLKFIPLIILLIAVGSGEHPAAAGSECLTPSPTTLAGKDPYGPIAVRDLSDREEQQIKSMLQSLTGDWRGTAVTLLCRGIDNPSDKEIQKLILRLTIEADYFGNTTLVAHFYETQERVRHFDTIRFYLKDHRLRVGSESGAGDIELIETANGVIRFLYRRLDAGARGASVRKEFFVHLTADARSFSFERTTYTQGRLTGREVWHADKY